MKICFKCNQEKSEEEFYKHPMMGDGLLGKCKECTKRDVRLNRSDKREKYHEYEKARFKTPKRKKILLECQRRRRIRNPEKHRAYLTLRRAMKRGIITRPKACPICKKTGMVQSHHKDYFKPLEVTWACFSCHRSIFHGQTVYQEVKS